MKNAPVLLFATAIAAACNSGSSYQTYQAGAGSGVGGVQGHASGSGGSSGTSGGVPDGGDAGYCNIQLTDLRSCTASTDCKCGQQCVADPAANNAMLCEIPCQTQSDCNDIYQPQVACINSFCSLNTCAQSFVGSAPGVFGGPCNVADAGDGTCQPEYTPTPGNLSGPQQLIGYCLPNGVLPKGTMSCANDELNPSLQCAPGLVCPFQYGIVGCAPVCNSVGATCPGGICLALFPGITTVGVCDPCEPRGEICLANSDCCYQPCLPDGGVTGGPASGSYCSF